MDEEISNIPKRRHNMTPCFARCQVAKAETKEQSTKNKAGENILGKLSAFSYHCPPAGRRTEPPEFVAFNLMAPARLFW